MELSVVDKAWFVGLMKQAGLSLREVARRMPMEASALSRSLNSDRKLKPTEIRRLAEILGRPTAEVLERVALPAEARIEAKGFGEMKQSDFTPHPMSADQATAPSKKPYRHPAWGALKGMITVLPDVDLTAPAYEDWKKLYGEDK